ncbi:MAG: FHA domain-containing protein [Archangium sp.]|nr:FHA domain-containing protein [Archangium sp.]
MGFQLVIAEGKEAGREFEFDQDSVLIGRTAECDVILYEAGVSRKHARIFSESTAFFIEDLGSSNGTRVNGSAISGKQNLKPGDSIAMGPVVFSFKPVELSPAEANTDDNAVGEDGSPHTRIVSLAEMKKSRNKAVVGLNKQAGREEVAEHGRRATAMIPALKGPRPSAPSTKRPSVSGKNTKLAAKDTDLPEGVEVAGGGRPKLARVSGERPAISAADRARYMREGPLGRFRLFWDTASKGTRSLVAGGAGLLALLIIGGIVSALIPEDAKPKAKEPEVISGDPIEFSFGLGEVTYERPDEKSFDFEVKSPVAVMVVLHYVSKNINSKDEVAITVNGVEVGWIPADTMEDKPQEQIIPANLVKRGEINTVTFDNVRNPPEEDPWSIRSLWIEVAVLPEKDEEGLKADADEKYKRGLLEWEQRDIGASNRWDAYKNFREAWLTLEAMPADRRPYTHRLAKDKMEETRRELDIKCRDLLLKARSAFNFAKYDQARYELDHVKDFFPTNTHPCQYKAEVERLEMDL